MDSLNKKFDEFKTEITSTSEIKKEITELIQDGTLEQLSKATPGSVVETVTGEIEKPDTNWVKVIILICAALLSTGGSIVALWNSLRNSGTDSSDSNG